MTDRRPPERRPYVRPFELDPATASIEPEAPHAGLPQPIAPARVGPLPHRSRFWGRLGALGLVAAIVAVVLDTAEGLAQRIALDPLTGWPMAILITIVAVTALTLFAREWLQLRRLQRRARYRAHGHKLAGSDLHGEAPALLATITHGLPVEQAVGEAVASYHRHGSDALSDGERLRLYERSVLRPLDQRAYRLVLESARDIGLLTAISPYGLLDGLLVLWRTTLMIRAVARLYGIAPGPAATAALLRRCLRNAALAGLADVATHAVLEHAGASIAAMLSARAGQGAGNGLLAAKLGIEAIKEARPLPFIEADPPSLREIRKVLFSTDKALAQSLREG